MVQGGGRRLLDMNGTQWMVLFAAWLGWGFDAFDALLFNYVAPNCVPTLLKLPLGSPEAKGATLAWTGALTSLLLVGWAIGGIVFGRVSDRVGRTKTLFLTMALYSLGTALCALAPNIWFLAACRFIASLGIGGEWAAGASMVAEVVPENRRVEAGALLYTSAPMGLFLATFVTYQIQGVFFKDSPETAWRWVLLTGLLPVVVALFVRRLVKEPKRWKDATAVAPPPGIGALFTPEYRAITLSGLAMALVALITWWSCNAFIPTVSSGLASREAVARGLNPVATQALIENWKAIAGNCFNIGGLIGTVLTVPLAKALGRKPMFIIYFIASAVTIWLGFGLNLSAFQRLYIYLPIGISVFGVLGSFTYYLPELFPTRLRSTGAGFCYNSGRVVAAAGPFLVGAIAARGADAVDTAIRVLFCVGFVPLLGLLVMPWMVETRGRALLD